jgi:hypothetical protein
MRTVVAFASIPPYLPYFIQGLGNSATPAGLYTSASVAFPSNTTPKSLLIASCSLTYNPSAVSVTSVQDTQGNTWVVLPNLAGLTNTGGGATETMWFAYALNTLGGANTVTFNFGGTGVYYAQIDVAEYANVSGLRAAGAGTIGSSATPTTDSITPQIGDLLLAYAGTYFATGSYLTAPPSGLVLRETVNSGSSGFADGLAVAAGSQSAAFTANMSSHWTAGLVAFIPVTPSTGVPNSLMLMGCGT